MKKLLVKGITIIVLLVCVIGIMDTMIDNAAYEVEAYVYDMRTPTDEELAIWWEEYAHGFEYDGEISVEIVELCGTTFTYNAYDDGVFNIYAEIWRDETIALYMEEVYGY